jgi:hypothetical protein
MDEEARKQRAVEAVAKYRDTLTSPERIAAFAVWFAEQEFGWKDTRKEPPMDMALVLLKDSKLNVVRLGYRTSGGGWCINVSSQRGSCRNCGHGFPDEPRLSTIYVHALD